jgi:hypothetical protein
MLTLALSPSATALFAAVDQGRAELVREREQLVLRLRAALAAVAKGERDPAAHHLEEALCLLGARPLPEASGCLGAIVLPLSLTDAEARRRYAEAVLLAQGNNRTAAARALHVSRRGLYFILPAARPAPPDPAPGQTDERSEQEGAA